jgi:hypothetical protein
LYGVWGTGEWGLGTGDRVRGKGERGTGNGALLPTLNGQLATRNRGSWVGDRRGTGNSGLGTRDWGLGSGLGHAYPPVTSH